MRSSAIVGLFLYAIVAARADLVFTNYSATNQLKIMPVGDSITDDCSINGAWRAPLQPLLITNTFQFTFVGRQTSTTNTTFTKGRHEGYCGAVIAAPGVFGAHQYATLSNYLQKIVPDALMIASNRPDAVLILIGANDLGTGRDPYVVATNHMAALLNLIFSNAPDANVILAKACSLLDGASFNGSVYGNYATNVPVYNAMLQKLVNERRALGQNVFLADMYSAVDFNTMFNSDHVHPNSLGLQAIAKEWLSRLQTITFRTNLVTTTFINGGALWKYNDWGLNPGTNWTRPDYDDSGWSNGIARLGYGDAAVATTVSFGPQSNNKFMTTYFRRSFVVPWNAMITNLNLRVARADGVVVYLNGQEIYRANLPAGPITYSTQASLLMSPYNRHIFFPTNVPVNLPAGTNWIAAEVHLKVPNVTAMGFDMELIGSGYPLLTPPLSISSAGDNAVTLTWPVPDGSSFSLYSTTNLDSKDSWTPASVIIQTNGGYITVTQSVDSRAIFFRLQQP